MIIDEALKQAAASLVAVSDTARLDAEIILEHVLGKSRSYLRAHADESLATQDEKQFMSLIARRLKGEPVAYIIGHKGFWSFDLRVNTDTLIPRPETELLIEAALDLFPDSTQHIRVADLGTGSGAIALALASERSQWEIFAVDASEAALRIASENAQRLRITNISFFCSNWFTALPVRGLDLVVSNPPYLSEREWPEYASGLAYEPRDALVSGEDGLDAIRQICGSSRDYLRSGGILMIEHGFQQGASIREIFAAAQFSDVKTLADLSGHERVTLGRI